MEIDNKITVVIPNYNGMQYIEKCLQSLEKQSMREFSIIVIDNGSTDGSAELVQDTFPSIQVVCMGANTGFSSAVNKGIELSDTCYVILLNNDTTVDINFVEEMEQSISKSEKIFSVSAKMVDMKNPKLIDGAGDLYCALGWAFARCKGDFVQKANKECKVFSACAGAAIYRKSVLDEIGVFDEHHFAYLEDVDLGYRARIYGYENWYTPKAIVYHAGSAVSGSRYNEFKISLASKNSVYLIYKNMPWIQILFNIPLLVFGFLVKILFFMKKGYGTLYCKGIIRGICFCHTKEAKERRVPIRFKNNTNYLIIQWELWINCIRKLVLGRN